MQSAQSPRVRTTAAAAFESRAHRPRPRIGELSRGFRDIWRCMPDTCGEGSRHEMDDDRTGKKLEGGEPVHPPEETGLHQLLEIPEYLGQGWSGCDRGRRC